MKASLRDSPSEERILEYKGRGKLLLENKQENQAIDYFQKALRLAREIQNVSEQCDILRLISKTYQSKGFLLLSVAYLRQILKLEFDNKLPTSKTLGEIAFIFQRLGQLDNALTYYRLALNNPPIEKETVILNNIAGIYESRGNHEKSLEYYQIALDESRDNGDLQSQIETLNNMGVIYMVLHQRDKAKKVYNEALSLANEIGDSQLINTVKANLKDFEDEIIEN